MSAKRRTTALVIGVWRYWAMAPARAGLELPATSLIAPLFAVIRCLPARIPAYSRGSDNKAGTGLAIRGRHLSARFFAGFTARNPRDDQPKSAIALMCRP